MLTGSSQGESSDREKKRCLTYRSAFAEVIARNRS